MAERDKINNSPTTEKISWINRLNTRVLLTVVLVLLLSLSVSQYILLLKQETNILSEEKDRAEFMAKGLLSSLQSLMLTGEATYTHDWLNRVSENPEISKLQVIRTDGYQAFHDSTTLDKVNAFLGSKAFQRSHTEKEKVTDIDGRLFGDAVSGKQVHSLNLEEESLTFLLPIPRGKECLECHGYDNNSQIGGVLRITTSISNAQKRITESKEASIISGLFIMLIIGLLLFVFIRRHILDPLEELNDATSHITDGDFNHNVTTYKNNNEITMLGKSFNHMVEKLRNTTVSKNYVENIMNSMGEMLLVTDDEKKIVSINPSVSDTLGYSKDELIGQHVDIITELKDTLFFDATDTQNIALECNFRTKDGELLPVLVTTSRLNQTRSNEEGIVHAARDITIQKNAEHELQLAAKVMENDSNAILICDKKGNIVLVNPAFCEITGYSKEEVIGKNPNILSSGIQPKEFYEAMWSELKNKGCWSGEIWNRRKNGEIYPESLSITTTHNDKGEITNYVSLFTDITNQKEIEQKLAHMAHHDALTGLPNRTLFVDRLEHALIHNKRDKLLVAVLFIDIDGFKLINDTHGHDIGDGLLKHISQSIIGTIREADTVARVGGDEFVIILENLNFTGNATSTADKIIKLFEEPFIIDEIPCKVGVSIGIAFHPDDGLNADELVKKADTAMYHSKTTGKMKYSVFNTSCTDKK